MYFEYSDLDLAELSQKDSHLAALIGSTDRIYRQVNPDTFSALIQSIVSQQISTKAADSIYIRLCSATGGITPKNILNTPQHIIRSCGLSGRKAEYIMGIAAAANSGDVDFSALDCMSDGEVIEKLTALRGVGIWTAEMLLIFSLGRKDIFSFNDLGIRRGLMRLYNLDSVTKKEFEIYRKKFSPHGSIASLYLWHLAGQKP